MNSQFSRQKKEQHKPSEVLWGKQTELSMQFFNIGSHCFSLMFIECLINIKRACVEINHDNGLLSDQTYNAILFACDELLRNEHLFDEYAKQFPLSIWQTGSGTQTHMNVNEVICSLANRYLDKKVMKEGDLNAVRCRIHANDHVNKSQSSNDVFPTAMHLLITSLSHQHLLPSLLHLHNSLLDKQTQFSSIMTVGRTHLMDALPMPVSGIFSGYCEQLTQAHSAIVESLHGLYQLAIGGTALGGGDNAPSHFGSQVALKLSNHYLLPFKTAVNKYAAISGQDALLRYSSALKQLASVLFKIASDVKLLGSGPHCGFNEWLLPENEAGSSIMPGKVNPTQCEALSMVCLQVFGNDLTVSLAASNGQLQLNTYRPIIVHNIMESMELLSDAMTSFSDNCINGLKLHQAQININLSQNFSSIALLSPALGYDICVQIFEEASNEHISLAATAEQLNLYTKIEFEKLLRSVLPLKEIRKG